MDVVIYHNPGCGTSRNTLALIRNAGVEPHVVEYLKTPPSRAMLTQLLERMGITPRDLLREKGTPFHELRLDDPTLDDAALIDAMMAHPILINRPIVVTPHGVRLCRPSEPVIGLLPPQRGELSQGGWRARRRRARHTGPLGLNPDRSRNRDLFCDARACHLPRHAAVRHLAAEGPRHRLERLAGAAVALRPA